MIGLPFKIIKWIIGTLLCIVVLYGSIAYLRSTKFGQESEALEAVEKITDATYSGTVGLMFPKEKGLSYYIKKHKWTARIVLVAVCLLAVYFTYKVFGIIKAIMLCLIIGAGIALDQKVIKELIN